MLVLNACAYWVSVSKLYKHAALVHRDSNLGAFLDYVGGRRTGLNEDVLDSELEHVINNSWPDEWANYEIHDVYFARAIFESSKAPAFLFSWVYHEHLFTTLP
mmetsp:Transcript_58633/g.132716  ORF Transcript_58633/g.132716 Transcript_58633/m.132716 type:complete len:103 (+) Transcript_58633:160-468(+)